jgi:hypothetical protein
MRHSFQKAGRAAALAMLFGVGAAPAAWAQLGPTTSAPGPVPDLSGGTATAQPQRRPPPSALPGAKTDTSRVTPATKSLSEMDPTLALFDSINRGDITTARDAINRGADLNGHNVLGMTPLELSIDLGRNDISFLLLSMRGGSSPVAASGTQQAKGAPPPKPAREVRATKVANAPKVVPPPQPRTAQLFSGDGGAPVPNAGFLGFDANGRN